MRSIPRAAPLLLVLCSVPGPDPAAAKPGADALERAMEDELARSLELELPGAEAPFFVSYLVDDVEVEVLLAEYGGILRRPSQRRRELRVDVRVGSPSFGASSTLRQGPGLITVDDDYAALRRQLWLATDAAYKAAADLLEQKRAELANAAEADDAVPEFSERQAHRLVVEEEPPDPELAPYEGLVRDLSALFHDYPEVQEGYVELTATRTRRTFASTEGTFTSEARALVELQVVARTQAEDGMPLGHRVAVVVPALDDLPERAELLRRTRKMLEELTRLRTAPVLEDYGGPVLFEGEAAGQILGRLLAPNVSGTPPVSDPRFRDVAGVGRETELARKIDKRVMPDGFRVIDDPGRQRFGEIPLVGGYEVDDEGVPAQEVELVEGGRLRRFLMSRAPREGFPGSTGHGRVGAFGPARAHASNLLVSARRGAATAALERRLLAEAREAGEDFGLVIRLLGGPGPEVLEPEDADRMRGDRGGAPALLPLVAYRVTAPGERELVRGFVLDRFSVRALKDILAAGRRPEPVSYVDQNGVPTSIVTPALLFEESEAREAEGSHPRPPVLESPVGRE